MLFLRFSRFNVFNLQPKTYNFKLLLRLDNSRTDTGTHDPTHHQRKQKNKSFKSFAILRLP